MENLEGNINEKNILFILDRIFDSVTVETSQEFKALKIEKEKAIDFNSMEKLSFRETGKSLLENFNQAI